MKPDAPRIDIPLADIFTAEDEPLRRLERQVERASFYTHTAIGLNALRLGDAESFLYGLMDVLLAKGLITPQEVETAVEKVKQEMAAKQDVPSANIAMRVDAETSAETPYVAVNCEERMPICKAVCCKLNFALSQSEIESGKIKWDLGQPYYIRHEAHGYCTHNDRTSGGCGIYADRPRVCSGYSCAHDDRIWKNFEAMELNHEWLDAHLNQPAQYRFVAAFMQADDSAPSDEP